MSQAQRVHVQYSGNVQGVGFRFTAERVALQLGVTGFVKNLRDGNVEVACEGSRAQLENFLTGIQDQMSGYISDFRADWEPATGEFSSFEIRF